MGRRLKHQWSIGHNYLTGITFGKWCKLRAENGFQISPAFFHRAAAIIPPEAVAVILCT